MPYNQKNQIGWKKPNLDLLSLQLQTESSQPQPRPNKSRTRMGLFTLH